MDAALQEKEQRQAWTITRIIVLSSWSVSLLSIIVLLGAAIYLSIVNPASPALPLIKGWGDLMLGFVIGQFTAFMKNVAAVNS